MHVTRALVLWALCLPGLAGCGTTYLLQAARGQWQVLAERRPIERVLADAATPEALRRQLTEIRQARRFASLDLGLPDNRSYTTYADVGRPFVVWNVVATPEFSVQPLQWCFPVAGCIAYRGYFREAAARGFADRLRRGGHDVAVGGVTAYSTLGRFADPVLSSMMRYGDLDVIGTLFHELAHQVIYVQGDSAFNEAFAVTVEQEGLARWLRAQGREADFREYLRRRAVQLEFVTLTRRARDRLAAEFARPDMNDDARRAAKAGVFAELAAELRALQARLGEQRGSGIGAWLDRGLNNAHLASVATYWDCVAGFETVLAQQGGSLTGFYAAVRRLARESPEARRAALCSVPPSSAPPREAPVPASGLAAG